MAATVNLTPVVLELGGKDPAIILPNTDLEQYASMWMRAVFQGSGQNCIGIERFIVPENLHDRFLDIMSARIKKLRLGSVLSSSPDGFVSVVDTGSMITDARFAELERLVKAAERDGAEIVSGGERWQHPYLEEGSYVPNNAFLPCLTRIWPVIGTLNQLSLATSTKTWKLRKLKVSHSALSMVNI